MQETARIVIIAESVVRTSIVYNFSKLVCSDTVIFEGPELESGRTWHSVSGIHTINGDSTLPNSSNTTLNYKEKYESSRAKI